MLKEIKKPTCLSKSWATNKDFTQNSFATRCLVPGVLSEMGGGKSPGRFTLKSIKSDLPSNRPAEIPPPQSLIFRQISTHTTDIMLCYRPAEIPPPPNRLFSDKFQLTQPTSCFAIQRSFLRKTNQNSNSTTTISNTVWFTFRFLWSLTWIVVLRAIIQLYDHSLGRGPPWAITPLRDHFFFKPNEWISNCTPRVILQYHIPLIWYMLFFSKMFSGFGDRFSRNPGSATVGCLIFFNKLQVKHWR